MDVEALSCALVRSLRGERSQRALSRRLQYTTNVVYLWESGRRWPTAAAFFWLAHRSDIDVEAAVRRFVPLEPDAPPLWRPEGVAALLRKLQGATPALELARRTGRSRDAVGRWLRGDAEPRLPDLLRLVDAASTRLLDFVALFVDPATLPPDIAATAWRRLEAARRLTHEQPWAPAVLLSLELEAYQALSRHDDGWLARRLGLPLQTVSTCLALLADAGQIQPAARGLWRRVEVQSVDTRIPSRPNDLKRWWSQVALDRIDADGNCSFTICAVSEADFVRIQALQRSYYRDLRALIAESTPSERVVLVNLQTLALDAP